MIMLKINVAGVLGENPSARAVIAYVKWHTDDIFFTIANMNNKREVPCRAGLVVSNNFSWECLATIRFEGIHKRRLRRQVTCLRLFCGLTRGQDRKANCGE